MLNLTPRSFQVFALTATFLFAAAHFGDVPAAGQNPSKDERVFDDPRQRFVARVYQDLLRRPVEPASLKMWTDRLAQGRSRVEVVRAVSNSSEYHTLVVRDLYSALMGREPDAQKLKDGVAILQSGGSPEKVRAGILGSAEYFANTDRDNSAFLDAVYQDVLHREVDPTGREAWSKALSSGSTRTQVAMNVLQSVEARRVLVEGYYDKFLRRAVKKAELDSWVEKMQRLPREQTILETLLTSEEYFALGS